MAAGIVTRLGRNLSRSSTGSSGSNTTRGNISYENDPFYQRVMADVAQRTSEQPSGVTANLSRGAVGTAKWGSLGGVGGYGVYRGGQAIEDYTDMRAMESKQMTNQEFSDAVENIREDDSLTPDQKQAMIEQLRKAHDEAQSGVEGGSNPVTDAYNRVMGDTGMIEKVLIALVVIAIVRGVSRRWE